MKKVKYLSDENSAELRDFIKNKAELPIFTGNDKRNGFPLI